MTVSGCLAPRRLWGVQGRGRRGLAVEDPVCQCKDSCLHLRHGLCTGRGRRGRAVGATPASRCVQLQQRRQGGPPRARLHDQRCQAPPPCPQRCLSVRPAVSSCRKARVSLMPSPMRLQCRDPPVSLITHRRVSWRPGCEPHVRVTDVSQTLMAGGPRGGTPAITQDAGTAGLWHA